MCGICGFRSYNLSKDEAKAAIHRMCDSLHHRGPDDMGMYQDHETVLGMRRLSIIDLSTGHQPIPNEDQTLWVMVNGEIYNFQELRKELLVRGHRFLTGSDSEVVLHLYEEEGENCLHHLQGMFGLAIWDTLNQRLFLARDRLGIKPLYYARLGQTFLFASELKAILQYPQFPRQINNQAVNLYLTYEYVPSPETIFNNIQKLPPGYCLTLDRGGNLSIRQYWELEYRSKIRLADEREYQEAILEKLRLSVQKRLISDVPLGTFLSGGIDSSLVAAMMKNLDQGKVESFNIGFSEKSFDESTYADMVAGYLKTNHRYHRFDPPVLLDILPKVVENLDEPLGDASILPTYLLCHFCRQYVTVALSGDGGDELFAGYYTYQAHRLARLYNLIPRFLREDLIEKIIRRLPVSTDNFSFDFKAKRFISGINYPYAIRNYIWLGSFTPEDKMALLQPGFYKTIKGHDEFSVIQRLLDSAPVEDWLDTLLYLDMKLYLQDDVLVKVDRASMANSLEVRVPFLDHDLVNLVTRIPSHLKLHGLKTKYILKQSARKLLPNTIIDRPKKGFGIPVAKWIKADLKSIFASAFRREVIQSQGIFNPDYIQGLLEEHWQGVADHRKKLWTLFMFQKWYDQFVNP